MVGPQFYRAHVLFELPLHMKWIFFDWIEMNKITQSEPGGGMAYLALLFVRQKIVSNTLNQFPTR